MIIKNKIDTKTNRLIKTNDISKKVDSCLYNNGCGFIRTITKSRIDIIIQSQLFIKSSTKYKYVNIEIT